MAIVRVLIDGYSLLHAWASLAPRAARFSAEARDALITRLTHFQDTQSTPITIFFDGQGAPPGVSKLPSTRKVEVLFSKPGKTADDLIERAAHRFLELGEVLVVTDDIAERTTVTGMGGMAVSCHTFIDEVESTLQSFSRDLREHNRREQNRFRR